MNAIYMIVDGRFLHLGRAQALELAQIWDVDVHLFIEDDKVTSFAPVADPRVTIHLNSIGAQLPSGLPQSTKWPVVVFYRIHVPRLLRQYDRLIFLDVDILCRKADPSIWSIDLPAGVGAVRDIITLNRAPLSTGLTREEWLSRIGVTHGRYFNAGVLLIDPARWDVDRMDHLLTDYFKTHQLKGIKSQDFINFAFDGQWVELSPRWNLQPDAFELGLEPILDPVFVHFCHRIKPWFFPGQPGRSRQRPEDEEDFFRILRAVDVDPSEVAEFDSESFSTRVKFRLRKALARLGLNQGRQQRALADWQARSERVWAHLEAKMASGGYADLNIALGQRPTPKLAFDGVTMRARQIAQA